ncbi:hypothetical protein FACS189413_01330 [Bacteroidia bacterium]|nr:hypothetical protein FACS189413_01330 [Bacteroidia bacterium]
MPSCIDENADVDFDTAFDNLVVGEVFGTPLIKEARTTIGEVLGKINEDGLPDELKIGFIKHPDYLDSVLTAFYTHKDVIEKNLEEINSDFEDFRYQMDVIKVGNYTLTNSNNFNLDYDLEDFINRKVADVNDGNKLKQVHKINQIDFSGDVEIVVTITDKSANIDQLLLQSIKFDVEIGGRTHIVPYNSAAQGWVLNLNGTTWSFADNNNKAHVTATLQNDQPIVITGASISVEVEVDTKKGGFVVWGWFNYTLVSGNISQDDIQDEVIPADIQSYLSQGTKLVFADPRLQMDIESNVGVPLQFVMVDLQNTTAGGSASLINDYEFNIEGSEYLNNAEKTVEKRFEIDKTHPFTGSDVAYYEGLFSTDLESLGLKYKVITKPIPLDEQGNLILTGIDRQHLSNLADIKILPKATLPMILGEGSIIVYSDTIEADMSEVKELDAVPDNTKAILYLGYKNTLPLGLGVTLKLLEEDETTEVKALVINDNTELSAINLDKTTEWKEIKLELRDPQALKKLRYVAVDTYSDGKVPITQKVAFTKGQGISLSLSADVKGRININELTKEEEQ